MRGILDRMQSPEEPLPTFVAHMLSEFTKLKTPPPEQEQIDLICKHALEKYRVALYGTFVSFGHGSSSEGPRAPCGLGAK